MIPGYTQKENKRGKAGKGHSMMEVIFNFHLNSKVLNFLKSLSKEILRNLFRMGVKYDTACQLR